MHAQYVGRLSQTKIRYKCGEDTVSLHPLLVETPVRFRPGVMIRTIDFDSGGPAENPLG